MKKTGLTLLFATLTLSLALTANGEVTNNQINQYNEAAQGNSDLVDIVHEMFEKAYKASPNDPVALFYLGASETLQGREAWMPWNKLSYTENGLARMEKALSMLSESEWQEKFLYLPKAVYMKASAAVVFTQVPDFFNFFDRGYALFEEVIADPAFQQAPTASTSWVYYYAVKAAEKQQNPTQMKAWAETLLKAGLQDEYTTKVTDLLNAG